MSLTASSAVVPVAARVRPAYVAYAGGAAAAAAVIATASDDGPVICIFRRCTGAYCPGCGATRAARHVATGDVAASWADHPWVLLAAVQVAVIGALFALSSRARHQITSRRHVTTLLYSNAVLLVGIWLIRASTHSIPGW